jgi:plastocyanin
MKTLFTERLMRRYTGQSKVGGIVLKLLVSSFLLSLAPAFAASPVQIDLRLENLANTAEAVQDAVISLRPVGVAVPKLTGKLYEVNQKDTRFVPLVLPIELGSRVRFLNQDPFSHSVYAISPAKSFELPLYKKTDPVPPPVLFDKPGRVTLGCNIHDIMVAHILVMDTPYFAKTEKGRARISVPPGKYQVTAWHPRAKDRDGVRYPEVLEVKESRSLSLKIDLRRPTPERSNPFRSGQYRR